MGKKNPEIVRFDTTGEPNTGPLRDLLDRKQREEASRNAEGSADVSKLKYGVGAARVGELSPDDKKEIFFRKIEAKFEELFNWPEIESRLLNKYSIATKKKLRGNLIQIKAHILKTAEEEGWDDLGFEEKHLTRVIQIGCQQQSETINKKYKIFHSIISELCEEKMEKPPGLEEQETGDPFAEIKDKYGALVDTRRYMDNGQWMHIIKLYPGKEEITVIFGEGNKDKGRNERIKLKDLDYLLEKYDLSEKPHVGRPGKADGNKIEEIILKARHVIDEAGKAKLARVEKIDVAKDNDAIKLEKPEAYNLLVDPSYLAGKKWVEKLSPDQLKEVDNYRELANRAIGDAISRKRQERVELLKSSKEVFSRTEEIIDFIRNFKENGLKKIKRGKPPAQLVFGPQNMAVIRNLTPDEQKIIEEELINCNRELKEKWKEHASSIIKERKTRKKPVPVGGTNTEPESEIEDKNEGLEEIREDEILPLKEKTAGQEKIEKSKQTEEYYEYGSEGELLGVKEELEREKKEKEPYEPGWEISALGAEGIFQNSDAMADRMERMKSELGVLKSEMDEVEKKYLARKAQNEEALKGIRNFFKDTSDLGEAGREEEGFRIKYEAKKIEYEMKLSEVESLKKEMEESSLESLGGEKQDGSREETEIKEIISETEKEIEAMPETERKKIELGLRNLGLYVQKWKSGALVEGLDYAAKFAYSKGMLGRVLSSAVETYKEDLSQAEKNIELADKKSSGLKSRLMLQVSNIGQLMGNILKLTGIVSGKRIFMGGAMFFARGFEIAKKTRLKNEKVIEKTRTNDIEAAQTAAFALYDKAKKESGGKEPSKEDLEKIYQQNIPEDVLKRLSETGPGVAGYLTQRLFRQHIKFSIGRYENLVRKIENDDKLDKKQKQMEKDRILTKFSKRLNDWDRIISQAGTVDAAAMGAKYGEMAGKAAISAAMAVTLHRILEKIPELLSEIDSRVGGELHKAAEYFEHQPIATIEGINTADITDESPTYPGYEKDQNSFLREKGVDPETLSDKMAEPAAVAPAETVPEPMPETVPEHMEVSTPAETPEPEAVPETAENHLPEAEVIEVSSGETGEYAMDQETMDSIDKMEMEKSSLTDRVAQEQISAKIYGGYVGSLRKFLCGSDREKWIAMKDMKAWDLLENRESIAHKFYDRILESDAKNIAKLKEQIAPLRGETVNAWAIRVGIVMKNLGIRKIN